MTLNKVNINSPARLPTLIVTLQIAHPKFSFDRLQCPSDTKL